MWFFGVTKQKLLLPTVHWWKRLVWWWSKWKKNGNYREDEFEFIWGVAFAAHIAHYTMV
jgi:hypothetical protein